MTPSSLDGSAEETRSGAGHVPCTPKKNPKPSGPTRPEVVLMMQGVQAERPLRELSPHRIAGYITHNALNPHCGVDRPNGTEGVVRLDRQHATDLTVRVPQLWRHAPPR